MKIIKKETKEKGGVYMNNNKMKKVKDFFKKEGFYIVLFLCLCVVTTVATLAFKRANESTAELENNDSEISVNVNDNKSKETQSDAADAKVNNNEIKNAERVENTKPKNENETKSEKSTAQVMANNDVKFSKPIEGVLVRTYKTTPVQVDENNWRTISGIDVKANLGTEVKAAAEGVVEKAEQGDVDEGMTIIINHANGVKTKYCYLDSDLKVKAVDKVTTGTVLGKVGNAPALFSKDKSEGYLNIQEFNSKNEEVDPGKYFSYKAEE